MSELRECPFCGGEAWIAEGLMECATELSWQVGCCAVMEGYASRDDAIAAWNRRTAPAQGPARERDAENTHTGLRNDRQSGGRASERSLRDENTRTVGERDAELERRIEKAAHAVAKDNELHEYGYYGRFMRISTAIRSALRPTQASPDQRETES